MKNCKRKNDIIKKLPAALSAVLLLFSASCSDPSANPRENFALSPLSTVPPAQSDGILTLASEPDQTSGDTAPVTQSAEVTEQETVPEITTAVLTETSAETEISQPPETSDTPDTSQIPESSKTPETASDPGTTTVPDTPTRPEVTDTDTSVTTAVRENPKIPGIPDPPSPSAPDWRGHVHTWGIKYAIRNPYDLSCGKPCDAYYYCKGCNVGMSQHFTVPAAEHIFENGRCIYCLKHDEAYLDAQGLTFGKNADGTYSITGMSASCTYEVIVLPSEHNGAPVTSIADGAFAGRTTLKRVILIGSTYDEIRLGEPECRLKKIGDRAFDGCTSLTDFNFPNTLEEIGSCAFRYTKPGEISVGCAVRKLGSYAFYGAGLSRVLLGNFRITEFEPYTFAESTIEYLSAPFTVTKIGAHAFENCKMLREMSCLPSQESFGEFALAGCTALDFVQYVDTENVIIGEDAFLDCTAFRIPDTDPVTGLVYRETTALQPDAAAGYKTEQPVVIIIGRGSWQGSDLIVPERINGLHVYGCDGFSNDAKLKSIVFPEGFESLSMSAFQHCPNLTEVVMPESMQVIGADCFIGCTSLSRVILKNVEAEIYDGAFYGVSGFETEYDADGLIYRLSADGSSYFVYSYRSTTSTPKELIIPTIHKGLPVTSIYKEAFKSAKALKSLTIPDSVTDIGAGAFGWSYIEKITLPATLKVIPNGCFANNNALKNVTLPDGLESIGNSAFLNCTSLQTPVIPDSVKKIGAFAFSGCASMTDMPIGKGMTSIPEDYIQNCTSIRKITVPAWIKEIDRRAFSWTVTEIVYENPLTVLTGEEDDNRPLTWIPGVEYICDEASGVRMYVNDDGAHIAGAVPGASQIVEIPAFCGDVPVVAIDDFAFMNSQSFVSGTRYVIPDSVTYLGKYVFRGSNIVEIDIGTLKEVPEYCFDLCSQLTTVTGNAVTSVGKNAFNQSGISTMPFPLLEEIGERGFANCPHLSGQQFFFDHLKTVGSEAFAYNSGIRVYTYVPDAVIASDAATKRMNGIVGIRS